MILLTTEQMEAALTVIYGHKPESRESMEGDTFSYRCHHCDGRMWGFDSKPESGLGSCPHCRKTVRIYRYAQVKPSNTNPEPSC
jgi:hypothetical protein